MIDRGQPLSRSLLWAFQRRYFEDQGIEAWRTNIVPSYITNNPYIARCYARVVLGYLRDCAAVLDPSQPLYIVELGGGGGRFAFHFLRSFEDLLARSPLAGLHFCYVLTDLPERNAAFWAEHPAFEEWVREGKLDFARFDAAGLQEGENPEIHLRHTGRTLAEGTLNNPLVFLANYFFDSLPQDAFHVEQGRVQECQIELVSQQEEADPTAPDVLPRVKIVFRTQEGDLEEYYHDPELDAVLQTYRFLENSYLLFPVGAIRLLRGLNRLAGGRMLLLSGDFGSTRAEAWDHNGAPDIRIHGSISMEVNYHALGAFVQNEGGRFFAPSSRAEFLTVCAFALGECPDGLAELALAYHEAIEQGGPNDFFLVKRGMEHSYPAVGLKEMLAFLRFSGWDTHLFLDLFPFLLEKLVSANGRDQADLLEALDPLWENYYHLGEERDLPFNIGVVFYRLGQPRRALDFFNRSLEIYGPSSMTLYNAALCLTKLRQYRRAWARMKQALLLEPGFEPALELAEELKEHRLSLRPE